MVLRQKQLDCTRVCILVIDKVGDLSNVYPAYRPMTAGIDSGPLATLCRISSMENE